ncbi:hypothetical protein IFO70_01075 [Phormidium tenue FACHB-886]|nr:hypothetical protein [Phormidium tenue FACHB-886]
MQVWIICLVLFFGIAEFYQWAKGLSLPMPVLIAAGVLLAVVSNLRSVRAASTVAAAAPQPATPPIAASAQPVVPSSAADCTTSSSISFTIRSPEAIVEE